MKFKTIKFNLIAALMICLIVLTIGFTSMPTVNPGDDPSGGGEPGGEIVDPDPEVPPDDIELPKYPLQLVQYAIDFLDNCKGYKSKFVQKTDTTELSIPVNVPVTQMIKSYAFRSGDKVLIETYTDCNLEYGAFWYRYFYGTPKDIEVYKVDKCDYVNETADLTAGTTKHQTIEQFDAENMNIYKFPFEFNASNSTVISDRIEGKYRKIKISFKKEAVSDNYKLQYYASGLVVPDTLNITDNLEFIFYISRTTGRMAKYEKFEYYKVKPTTFPSATATMASHYTEEYLVLDKEIDFTSPKER